MVSYEVMNERCWWSCVVRGWMFNKDNSRGGVPWNCDNPNDCANSYVILLMQTTWSILELRQFWLIRTKPCHVVLPQFQRHTRRGHWPVYTLLNYLWIVYAQYPQGAPQNHVFCKITASISCTVPDTVCKLWNWLWAMYAQYPRGVCPRTACFAI